MPKAVTLAVMSTLAAVAVTGTSTPTATAHDSINSCGNTIQTPHLHQPPGSPGDGDQDEPPPPPDDDINEPQPPPDDDLLNPPPPPGGELQGIDRNLQVTQVTCQNGDNNFAVTSKTT